MTTSPDPVDFRDLIARATLKEHIAAYWCDPRETPCVEGNCQCLDAATRRTVATLRALDDAGLAVVPKSAPEVALIAVEGARPSEGATLQYVKMVKAANLIPDALR